MSEGSTELLPKEIGAEQKPFPILPEWFDAYKKSNRAHPQAVYGTQAYLGRAILHSLKDNEVSIEDVLRSDFTQEQVDELKPAVKIMHANHNIKVMPEGMAENGEREFDDSFFSGFWKRANKQVLLSLVKFTNETSETNKEDLDLENALTPNPFGPVPLDIPKVIHDFQAYTKRHPEFEDTIQSVSNMYDAACDALETPEARKLAKERIDYFSSPNPDEKRRTGIDPEPYNKQVLLMRGMLETIQQAAIKHHVPDNVSWDFLYSVSTVPVTDLRDLFQEIKGSEGESRILSDVRKLQPV